MMSVAMPSIEMPELCCLNELVAQTENDDVVDRS